MAKQARKRLLVMKSPLNFGDHWLSGKAKFRHNRCLIAKHYKARFGISGNDHGKDAL
jgi:hypothetical protein